MSASRSVPRDYDLDLRSFADPNVNRARPAALTYRHQNDHVYIGRRGAAVREFHVSRI